YKSSCGKAHTYECAQITHLNTLFQFFRCVCGGESIWIMARWVYAYWCRDDDHARHEPNASQQTLSASAMAHATQLLVTLEKTKSIHLMNALVIASPIKTTAPP